MTTHFIADKEEMKKHDGILLPADFRVTLTRQTDDADTWLLEEAVAGGWKPDGLLTYRRHSGV